MTWIVIGVVITYLLVNSPLIYSLIYGHGPKGIAQLWGYAPNQFLFLVVIYPFASFATFMALRSFIVKLYPALPFDSKLAPIIDHWPIAVLVALVIACLLTILVYFTSAWSFDKLKPQYAEMALKSISEFEDDVTGSSLKKEEQDSFRKQLIRKAHVELEAIPFTGTRDEVSVQRWLERLSPAAYLQVMQDKKLPHKLRLLEPAIHVLNVFQITITLFVGACALFVTIACVVYGREAGFTGDNLPHVKITLEAVFAAVFFFSFYIICYHQYRSQIEELVGTQTTILQDVAVAAVVVAAFIGIRMVDPSNRELSVLSVLKFWPAAVFVSGVALEETIPQLTRQIIGSETTLGFQIIFSFIFAILASIPTIRLVINQ